MEDDDDVDSDSVVPGIDKLLRTKPMSAWIVVMSLDGGKSTMNVVVVSNDVLYSDTCFDIVLWWLFAAIGVASLSIDD